MAVSASDIATAKLEQSVNVPALAPPPGVTPNFAAHNERAAVYHTLCSILLIILYVSLCLRLYAKVWIKRNPGFDDLACVLAVVGLSACFALGVVMQRHGVGKHQWDVPLSKLPTILKLGKYNSIILPPTMLCVKLSLLLLYLRIFAPNKVIRYVIYVGMTICIGAYTTLMFLAIFANIVTLIGVSKTLGVVNFVSDVYILCVPISAISKLQLPTQQKVGVVLVFMTGIIACAMSAIGIVFRFQVHQSEADATYLVSGTLLVTNIEEEIGLMCTCMPFFPAIVKNSATLTKFTHSVASLGSIWATRLGQNSASTDGRSYQKHVSCDGSVEDGLELNRREDNTKPALSESPKKTPRTEAGAFAWNERATFSHGKV